ncbi:SRPBCC family protein [Streptomyces sp. AC602_WCS936]|uniref:SRPBCC family protein n=1 Tax=Streptomyces sp. AC602_WCS936 TaxID=2823685 RepID=UPI001C2648B1|nr:SRPBCC family protein [Streptomyces sp. AC602_WCS936]
MEHEVFVPVPAERLGDALADPARVARALPGLQQDAGAEPVTGRLKVRVGSHSITYRGALRLTARDDGTYAVEGDATESRGTGTVALALTLRVADADGGCTLVIAGTATADGRVTELPADAVTSATTRLLTRFAENLGRAAEQEAKPGQETAPEPETEPETAPRPGQESAPEHVSVFDTEVPPSSLEDETETGTGAEADAGAGTDAVGGPQAPGTPEAPEPPPAEAAHARRTMIGRSAEEVDHAPPRGRYAPVPAPHAGVAGTSLRWAAPAAALVVASAIVVGRALRRRR